jgi:hypothetical protein
MHWLQLSLVKHVKFQSTTDKQKYYEWGNLGYEFIDFQAILDLIFMITDSYLNYYQNKIYDNI